MNARSVGAAVGPPASERVPPPAALAREPRISKTAVPHGARATAARNFAWLMLDKGLAVVFGLTVFGLIARGLGSVASGHFAYALALLQSALGLSMVCSAAALLPRLCRMQGGVAGALANVFVVRLAGSVLAALAAAVFALAAISDPERLRITLVIIASVPLIEPFFTAVVYWQSRNDNRRPTLVRASGLLTRALVVLAAIVVGAPLWVVALAWVCEAAVAALLLYASLRPVASPRAFARRFSLRRSTAYARYGVRFLAGMWLASLFLRLDRLVLGELLPAHDFGIYASAMQLVDVWLQIISLTGFAIGPAFLYKALTDVDHPWHLWRVVLILAAVGCAGVAGAMLLGPLALGLVYGAPFAAAAPYLVAGTGVGVLLFVDLLVQMHITASNRPLLLTVKWATACCVAVAFMAATFQSLGAFAGATGLSAGVVAGWIAVWAATRGTRPPLKRVSP